MRLPEKAFRPERLPLPIPHVDTGHNLPEVFESRDRPVHDLGERPIVASVQASIDSVQAVAETGPGAGDPKNHRPELRNLYNGRVRKGEHVHVFPLSNWNELDVRRGAVRSQVGLP